MSTKSGRTRHAKRRRTRQPATAGSTGKNKHVPAYRKLATWLGSANKAALGAVAAGVAAGVAGIITAAVMAIPHQVASVVGPWANPAPTPSPLVVVGGASPGLQPSGPGGPLDSIPAGQPDPCDLNGEYVIPGTVRPEGTVTTADVARLIGKAGDATETDGSYVLQAGSGKTVLLTGVHTELLRRVPAPRSTVLVVSSLCPGAPACPNGAYELDATIDLDAANLTPKLSRVDLCTGKATPIAIPATIVTEGQPLPIQFTAKTGKYDVTWRLRFDYVADGNAASSVIPAAGTSFQTDATASNPVVYLTLNPNGSTWTASSKPPYS